MKQDNKTTPREEFDAAHTNDLVVIEAKGDFKKGVPRGYAEGIATVGGIQTGKRSKWFIKIDRYQQRDQFGYIIDPSVDLEVSPGW